MDSYCPSCGTQRIGELQFCRSCGYDFAKAPPAAAASAKPAATPSAPAEAKPDKKPGNPVPGCALLLLILGVGIAVFLNQQAGPSKPGSTSSDLPPAGQIWFGPSFDSSTFVLASKFSSVSAKAPVAAVAHLTRSMSGSELGMRTYFDGQLIAAVAVGWDGSGEVWGWSPGPLIEPGTWRYELTDVGGNVLASGSITGT